jgi:hypothetical protein
MAPNDPGWAHPGFGAATMIAIPASATAEPSRSHLDGVTPSTSQSHPIAVAT